MAIKKQKSSKSAKCKLGQPCAAIESPTSCARKIQLGQISIYCQDISIFILFITVTKAPWSNSVFSKN